MAVSDDQACGRLTPGMNSAVRCSVLSVRAMACATTAKPAEGRHRGGRSKTDLPWRRYESLFHLHQWTQCPTGDNLVTSTGVVNAGRPCSRRSDRGRPHTPG